MSVPIEVTRIETTHVVVSSFVHEGALLAPFCATVRAASMPSPFRGQRRGPVVAFHVAVRSERGESAWPRPWIPPIGHAIDHGCNAPEPFRRASRKAGLGAAAGCDRAVRTRPSNQLEECI